jgi:transcriptional regulator with XRE-family HTH domain
VQEKSTQIYLIDVNAVSGKSRTMAKASEQDPETAAFCRSLDFLMRRAGLSGKALSQELGIPESTISRWRSGARLPHRSTLLRLAEYFAVDPELMITPGMLPVPMTPIILDDEGSDRELRDKCIAHLGAFLQVAGDRLGGIEWTWSELQHRFPLDKWKRDL